MIVTITSLRLRSLFGFFRLSWWGFRISRQAMKSPGFIQMRNRGFGYVHYTMSAWENLQAAKSFAHKGEHLAAMKEQSNLSTEIRIYSYESTHLPDWKNAEQLLQTHGRVIR